MTVADEGAHRVPMNALCWSCLNVVRELGLPRGHRVRKPEVDVQAAARDMWKDARRRVYLGDAGLRRLLADLQAPERTSQRDINGDPLHEHPDTAALRALEAAFVAMRDDYRRLQMEHYQLQQSVADTAARLRRMRDGLDRV